MRLSTKNSLPIVSTFGLVFLVIALSPFRIDPLFSIKEDIFVFVSSFLLVFGIIHIIKNGFRINLPILLFCSYILYMAISLLWVINLHEGLKELYRLVLTLSVMFVVYQIKNVFKMRVFIIAGMVMGVIVSVLGICEYFGYPILFGEQGKILSLFGHQNLLAQYLAICLVWSFFYWFYRDKHSWFIILSFIIITYGLFITTCRSAWFAVTLSLILILTNAYQKKDIKHLYKKTVVIFVTTVFVFFTYLCIDSYFSTTTKAQDAFVIKRPQGQYGFLSGRDKIWEATTELIKKNPSIGCGIGNYWITYPSVDPQFVEFSKYAHNDYLQVLSEGGIIGFILFMGFLIWSIVKIVEHEPKNTDRLVYYSLFSGILVILIDSFFSYDLYVPIPTFIFAVSLGVLLKMSKESSGKTICLNLPAKIISITLCIVIIASCIHFVVKRNIGYYHYLKASVLINESTSKNNSIPEAKRHIESARKYLPYDPEISFWDIMLELHDANFAGAKQKGYELLKLTPYEKKILLLMAKIEALLGNEGKSKELSKRISSNNNVLHSTYVQDLLAHYNCFSSAIHNDFLEKETVKNMLSETTKKITESDIVSDNLFFLRAVMLIKLNQWKNAVPDLSRCITNDSENYPLAYMLRAMIYAKTGELQSAKNDYDKYLSFDPASETALSGSGIVSLKMRNFQDAEEKFKAVLAMNPHNTKTLRNMGILQLSKGNIKSAHDFFRRSLEIDPNQANAEDIRKLISELDNSG